MDDEKYASLKIENIVASGSIAHSLDLEELTKKIDGCELNKKRFPGAVYRLENPKMASLLFTSGKVVLTGLQSHESLKTGQEKILARLKETGAELLETPDVKVTNIVCSYDLGRKINLNRIVITLNLENIEYEPEQFPGLVYRIEEPKIVALIFSSGKIILTGGKNLDDIRGGLEVLEKKLETIF